VTAVPGKPDPGLKRRVGPTAGAVTVNVVDADSVATFVVAVTVYVPDAPEATVKPPLNAPAEMEHDDELKRPDGDDDREHVVP
jgi:hypothetical protein